MRADTPVVATPSGERAIGSLKPGDTVLAYDPATGKAQAEPVQYTWVNHDRDLVDMRLKVGPDGAASQPAARATANGTSSRGRQQSRPSGEGALRQRLARGPRAVAPVAAVLHGLPPWDIVYQQARRWLNAGGMAALRVGRDVGGARALLPRALQSDGAQMVARVSGRT